MIGPIVALSIDKYVLQLAYPKGTALYTVFNWLLLQVLASLLIVPESEGSAFKSEGHGATEYWPLNTGQIETQSHKSQRVFARSTLIFLCTRIVKKFAHIPHLPTTKTLYFAPRTAIV